MASSALKYAIVVTDAMQGRTIKSLCQSELKISRRLLRQFVVKNAVSCNGEPAYLTRRVIAGDIINIMFPSESSEIPPEALPIDIRYEDDEVVVVNKPPGVLTHPTARERTGSMLARVGHHLQAQGLVPHTVHRLDRDTSGVVMFAKHGHMHHLYDLALRADDMHRTYVALVELGKKNARIEWQTIDLPIAQDPNKPSRRIISATGQRAVTHYRFIAATDRMGLAVIRLETGRTHQIRLHFAASGMALLGDPDYRARGMRKVSEFANVLPRQALHAYQLAWRHPITGVTRYAIAPVPDDLRGAWQAIGGEDEVWNALETMIATANSDLLR